MCNGSPLAWFSNTYPISINQSWRCRSDLRALENVGTHRPLEKRREHQVPHAATPSMAKSQASAMRLQTRHTGRNSRGSPFTTPGRSGQVNRDFPGWLKPLAAPMFWPLRGIGAKNACPYTCMYVCIMWILFIIYIYLYIYEQLYISIYIYVYIYIYIYMCVCGVHTVHMRVQVSPIYVFLSYFSVRCYVI